MKLRSVVTGIFFSTLVAPFALAQAPAQPAAPAPAAQPATGGGDAPAPAAAPTAAPTTDPRTTGNLGGHSYSDKPAVRTGGKRAKLHKAQGPLVNLPGFEQLGDGGSRLFVQLSQSVPVEERRAQGQLTFILKGAHARVWNNTNPLVTVHFNTPVAQARLVPHGNDLHFVVDLRAPATPTWKMNDGADKTAMLTVDFAKGSFVADETNVEKTAEPQKTVQSVGKRGQGQGAAKPGAEPPPPPAPPSSAAPAAPAPTPGPTP